MSLDVLNGCDLKDEPHVMENKVGVTGPRPELVYSLARLLELKCHPLAQIWPAYLDPAYKNSRGVWDPDRWHLDQKRSETPVLEKAKDGERTKDRPSSILAEGIKGSEDAIILSPQRGSFLSGCQAVKDELSLRPDMPGAGGRRVGSGRILRTEKEEFPPNRGSRARNDRENGRGEWDRQFSKYGFSREEEEQGVQRRGWPTEDRREQYPDDRGGDRRRGRGGSSSQVRRTHHASENEPEWMNESVSLTDIIELKGFDESKGGRGSRPNSRQSNKSDRVVRSEQSGSAGQEQRGPSFVHDGQEKDGFNFDQIMESVNLNSLLGGMGAAEPTEGKPASGSRFSQFFNKPRSRKSSIQDELLGNNILREINGEPIIKIPSPEESNKYHFTPISPAAKTGQSSNSLLDMLQKGGQQGKGESVVQKLEDGIKRQLGLENGAGPQPPQQLPPPPKPAQDELSAYEKLVAQVKSQPGGERPPVAGYMPGLVRPTPISSLPPNVTTEQEILEGRAMAAQRMHIHQGMPLQLIQYLEHYQLNPEVLKRPETENLLRCVHTGTYPVENLVEQLSNPALNPRNRDIILTVLKLRTLSHNFPPPLQNLLAPHLMSRASPHDHHLSHPPPAPQSRVSPLMFPGMGNNGHLAVSPGPPQNQRVPSPQEMTVLTQQILQQALIKKKLEEQKENYRKKQEGKSDREDKENIRGIKSSDNGSAGSPLAFMPTSVMRKSAADRKDSDPKPGVPELKITGQEESKDKPGPPSPGRPIKGKGSDRPGSLDLAGRNVRNTSGRGSTPQQQQPQQHGIMGGAPNLVGVPQNLQNPLLFLSNPQAIMGAGGMTGFVPGAGNLAGLMGGRFQHPGMLAGANAHPGMRVGPPSPRGQPPVSPGQTPLSRFFPNEMLAAAAAAQGAARLKMPPLPTGQAMTLEEIERQAGTVKI